ncbi:MAG: hypothetical protein RIS47_1756 [Bacteroidota bacterium]|jgi:hypothetical protein
MLEEELPNAELGVDESSQLSTKQENANIKKVREILFGKNINDIDKRFSQIEDFFNVEIDNSRQQAKAFYENLEAYIRTELKTIHQTVDSREQNLNAELVSMSDSIRQLNDSLSSFERSSNAQVRRDYDTLNKKNLEIIEQLQVESKQRIETIVRLENDMNEIKNVLTVQTGNLGEMRQNVFKQIFDQSKMMDKRVADEQSKRENREHNMQLAVDALGERIVELKSETSRQFSDIGQQVRRHQSLVDSEIPEAIRVAELRQADLSRLIRNSLEEVTAKFGSFSQQTTDDFKDIRDTLHTQLKGLRFELEQQNQRVMGKLRSEQDIQRQQKVDRNTLALLFSELALRLGDEGNDD